MQTEHDENALNAAGETPAEQLTAALAGPEETIVASETRQPVNQSTLVIFAILIIAAAGLYLMYRKAGPKPASAAVARETVEAKKTISGFLSGGQASIRTMETLLRNTEKIVQQFLMYPSTTQVPLSDLRTNPFRRHVPQNPFGSDSASARKREEERLAILKAVQSLQLQSIICSETRKACMINNTLYREGQSFDNFTIESISPSSVIVKNGPYRFELRMQK